MNQRFVERLSQTTRSAALIYLFQVNRNSAHSNLDWRVFAHQVIKFYTFDIGFHIDWQRD